MEISLKDYLEQCKEENYKDLCAEYKAVRQLRVEAEEKELELRKKLEFHSKGNRLEYGVKVQTIETRGAIKYKDLPEVQKLDANYLDAFREPTRTSIRVSIYG